MSTKYVHPGQVFNHPGTLKAGVTLEAQSGPPGQPGGVIEVQSFGINDGTVVLDGGATGGGTGASLLVQGTGTNNGKVIVNGGAGGHGIGGTGGSGASLAIAGAATNNGRITLTTGGLGTGGGGAGTGGVLIDSGSLSNAGVIDLQGRDATASSLTVTASGQLSDGGKITGTGFVDNEGVITGGGAGHPTGTIEVAVVNDGVINSNGNLAIIGSITGTGELDVSNGGLLALDRAVGSGQTVVFEGSHGQLDLAEPELFLAPIDGFAGMDELNLTGLDYVAGSTFATFDGGVLTVTDGLETDTFELVGVAEGTLFTAVQDGSGGVEVEEAAQCFVAGTRIATPSGERAVEDFAIGDLVTTLHGARKPIKWIGRRSYEGRFIAGNHLMLPVCIKADALGPNVPRRDLHVSAGHALYIDGVLVPAWRLINGVSIVQPSSVESVSYVHLELEDHDVIFAEGAAAETYLDEQSRRQFANVAEFAALYPEEEPAPIRCAERVEDGFVLDAIQRRLAARAFVTTSANPPGALRGCLEVAGPDRLVGWAQDAENPEQPVCLDLVADGRRIFRLLANRYRADVRGAGLGTGCHGFDLALPAGLVTAQTGALQLRRASDGAVLPATPDAVRVPRLAAQAGR